MARGKYTVNEVEERTGVAAGTLRQWERRYGFPRPERSESGYRLYSDPDVDAIEAMKRAIDDGVPASRAAELVQAAGATRRPRPLVELRDELVEALASLDEGRADRVLGEAHALHAVDDVLLGVIRGAMVEIGCRWHAGDLDVGVEHFASGYVHGRLRALLGLAGEPSVAPLVVLACVPGERHELGSLLLAVLLRRDGFRVVHLGADTPFDDLRRVAARLEADAVLLSASAAARLRPFERTRETLRDLAPHVVLGGRAVDDDPALAARCGAVALPGDPREVPGRLRALLHREGEVQPG